MAVMIILSLLGWILIGILNKKFVTKSYIATLVMLLIANGTMLAIV